jgi:hypothetical protein
VVCRTDLFCIVSQRDAKKYQINISTTSNNTIHDVSVPLDVSALRNEKLHAFMPRNVSADLGETFFRRVVHASFELISARILAL